MTLTRRTLLQGAGAMPALAQTANGPMNLIHIGVDTWSTHFLGCYGNETIRTPHVDALAAKSVVFEDAYPEVLPTIPARRCIYTGRRIFPSEMIAQPDDQVKIRGWHQLYAEDVTISETLQAAGYTTAFMSDVYHQFKPNKNFHRGFDCWRYIRGQEADRLETGGRSRINLDDYMHKSQPRPAAKAQGGVLQYLLNRQNWKTADDFLAAQVFREAEQWLGNNVAENSPFYLHIESFSPHEFWDPPEEFYRPYMKSNYRGPKLIMPPNMTTNMSAVEVEHAVALYKGLVTFVDDRIGKLLRTVHRLGLMQNTMIVFVADHGTMMGEQNQLHKGEQRLRTQVTHVPLMIYSPREQWAGKRVAGYVQHPDLMPTLLDSLGVGIPKRVTGESLRTLHPPKRDTIITGWGEHATIRTREWVYIGRWSAGPKFEQLYKLANDPLELKNVAAENPAVVEDFRVQLKRHVDAGWSITKGTFA